MPRRACRPAAPDCLVQGDLEQLGAACDSIPQCVALRVKPGELERSQITAMGVQQEGRLAACSRCDACPRPGAPTPHCRAGPAFLQAGWACPGRRPSQSQRMTRLNKASISTPTQLSMVRVPAARSACSSCLLLLVPGASLQAQPSPPCCHPHTRMPVNNTRLQLQSGGTFGDTAGSQTTTTTSSSNSSLSAGAIAGIAVGATVVALAAAGGGWVLLHRRQQSQRTAGGHLPEAGAGEEGAKAATEGPSSLSWGSSQPTAPSAHGLSTGTASTPAAAHAKGGSTATSCHVERVFSLRGPTPPSPFAATASRARSSLGTAGTSSPRPGASPFAAAGLARATASPSASQPGGSPVHPSGAFSAESGGLALLVGIPSTSVKADGSSGTGSGSGSASQMLPELRAHVAEVRRLAHRAAGLQTAQTGARPSRPVTPHTCLALRPRHHPGLHGSGFTLPRPSCPRL